VRGVPPRGICLSVCLSTSVYICLPAHPGMFYFPMVVKTAHLAALRDYVTKLHGATHFDAVFAELIARQAWPPFRAALVCLHGSLASFSHPCLHSPTPVVGGPRSQADSTARAFDCLASAPGRAACWPQCPLSHLCVWCAGAA
jgi:hypothetical protein